MIWKKNSYVEKKKGKRNYPRNYTWCAIIYSKVKFKFFEPHDNTYWTHMLVHRKYMNKFFNQAKPTTQATEAAVYGLFFQNQGSYNFYLVGQNLWRFMMMYLYFFSRLRIICLLGKFYLIMTVSTYGSFNIIFHSLTAFT